MINVLPFSHFLAFLLYCALIVLILWKDSKSLLNRVCAAFLACFALWSYGFIFLHNPDTLEETAILFNNLASIGWISFASLFLWFILIFTEKRRILKNKIFYLVIFSLPILLIYKKWTGHLTADFIKLSWGWARIWSSSFWTYLYYTYYLSFTLISLYLIYNFGRRTKSIAKKRQTKIIFLTAVIPLFLGSLIDVLLPVLTVTSVPLSFSSMAALIWAGGLFYVINKYKLMAVTPLTAAETIVSTMVDSLLLLDGEGKTTTVNQSMINLSGYQEEQLKGKSPVILFKDKDFQYNFLDKASKKGGFRNYELTLKTKKGKDVPILFSSSTVVNEQKEPVGIVCIIKDITERKEVEEKLRKSQEEFLNLFQNNPEATVHTDENGNILNINTRFIELFGYKLDEVKGKNIDSCLIQPPEKITEVEQFTRRGLAERYINVEAIRKKKDGTLFPVRISGSPLYINGKVEGMIGVYQDISTRKNMEAQLKKLAHIDILTSCYNRRYGLDLLHRQMKISFRYQSPLLLAFLDIDNFKAINDTYGHNEGDWVLKELATIFRSSLREIDIICRMGGDEFLLVFPGSSLKEAPIIKGRLDDKLFQKNQSIEKKYLITYSIGFSEYRPENPISIDELISIADQRMYEDKKNTKNYFRNSNIIPG